MGKDTEKSAAGRRTGAIAAGAAAVGEAVASYLKINFTQINQNASVLIQGVSLDTKEPHAPDRQFNVGMQYVLPLGTAGSVTSRIKVFGAAPTNKPGIRARRYPKSPHRRA